MNTNMKMNSKQLAQTLDRLLPKVEKPARYIGGEIHSIVKRPGPDTVRLAFCFPDSYEIGMSYLGMQILYHCLNKSEHVYCERSFAPAKDMAAEMEKTGMPLYTLETKTPLGDMDIIGFTLQYELCYTNILMMLKQSGLSVNAADRAEDDPLIVAGGPCAFNAEPLADFLDLVMVGDGEEQFPQLCELYYKKKQTGMSKLDFLKEACLMPGIYVPSFYQPEYDENGRYTGYRKLYDKAPDTVMKAVISDLNDVDFPTEHVVPLVEIVQDRAVTEIFRGCTRGCRFCQAGMLYRPVRERSRENILKITENQIESSGQGELSVLSLSTSDYSDFQGMIGDLMDYCGKKQVTLSLPSLRLDNFAFKVMDEMQGMKKTGLTFAPEAGTQRLRDVINKNITEDDIFTALDKAMDLGWSSVKLYFMMGLPTETDEDLEGIADISARIMALARSKGVRFSVSVSVANFVPKPYTPFQWVAQNSPEEFDRKHKFLKERMDRIKGVTYHYHGSFTSHLEAIFARGGRELCETLRRASDMGCCFDAWTEGFDQNKWEQALKQSGINRSYFALNELDTDDALPWDVIDCGVSKAYLKREYLRAMAGQTTPDCRLGCNGCGINRFTECRLGGIYE